MSFFIHDRNHFFLSDAAIFGIDKIGVELGKSWYPDHFYAYAFTPIDTTFINEKNDQCVSAKEIEGVNILECWERYIDSTLNCTLPWRTNEFPPKKSLCSHKWEYNDYLANCHKYSEPHALRNIAKCNPGCKRYEYTTKLFRKAALRDLDKNTSNMLMLDFFLLQHHIPVREHVHDYDALNLVSDFGGWLGLLLGYSILGFYDTLLFIIGNVKKTMTRKRQMTTTPNETTGQKPGEMIKTSKAIQVELCQEDNITGMQAMENKIHIEDKVTLIICIREMFN